MTKIWLLVTSAVAVSVDSFVVGFGVCLDKKSDARLPCAVGFATLLLCLATTVLGKILQTYVENCVKYLSAMLLFWLAVGSLRKEKSILLLRDLSLRECLSIGFTVGLDGAVANLTLVSLNLGIITPMVIAVAHLVAVAIGQNLASKMQINHAEKFSAVTLFALALLKLME